MFFTITNTTIDTCSTELFKQWIPLQAKKNILRYKLKNRDKILEKYCIQYYHKGLKNICLDLISNCKYQIGNSNEVIVIFENKDDNKIANFITYGNRSIQGSSILKDIFATI